MFMGSQWNIGILKLGNHSWVIVCQIPVIVGSGTVVWVGYRSSMLALSRFHLCCISIWVLKCLMLKSQPVKYFSTTQCKRGSSILSKPSVSLMITITVTGLAALVSHLWYQSRPLPRVRPHAFTFSGVQSHTSPTLTLSPKLKQSVYWPCLPTRSDWSQCLQFFPSGACDQR